MEPMNEDHTFQAVLGVLDRELGIDNDGLDFKQLEEYITNDSVCFPQDDIIPAIAYTNGPEHLAHDQHLQQQLSQAHPMNEQMKLQHEKLQGHNNPHCAYPETTYTNSSPQYISETLPETPPDSGSEPYSPDNQDNKLGPMSSLSNIPNSLFGHQQQANNMSRYGGGMGDYHDHRHNSVSDHDQRHPSISEFRELPRLNYPHTSSSHSPTISSHATPHIVPPFGSIPSQEYTGNPQKKRKYPSPSGSLSGSSLNPALISSVLNIKQEPDLSDYNHDEYSYDLPPDSTSIFLEGTYQVIKWQTHNPTKWCALLDSSCKDLPTSGYRVDSDKGFNFSVPDDAFVCQKKNHFQVTVHVGMAGEPTYVRSPDGVKKIDGFHIHFFGIKMESPTQTIRIEQSQSDRSKKSFHPVKVDLPPDQTTKVTVGRLHYSETTSNNMRKKGKPNPDQRYFRLVVALKAHCGDNSYLIAAHHSEKIIVRASNPGQFESDVDVQWQKGQTPDAVFHAGRVGVNTDRPDEALTVHGNLKLSGHVVQPSDMRAKENFVEMDSKDQLNRVAQLRIYQYEYTDEFAQHAGLGELDIRDTGVLAQELREVLPDAVREAGDVKLPNGEIIDNFLVVNKDRIYMENVGAVKELCKLTDNLENRIDELEKVNKKLSKIKRVDSVKSTASGKSISSTITTLSFYSRGSTPPNKKQKQGNTGYYKDKKGRYVPHSLPVGKENSLCSNKLIQIAITTLVLIMAFCLVSITTLYILETRKTNPSVLSETGAPGGGNSQTGVPGGGNTRPGSNDTSFIPPAGMESTIATTMKSSVSTRTTESTVIFLNPRKVITPPSCKPNGESCEKSSCCSLPPLQNDQPPATDPTYTIIHEDPNPGVKVVGKSKKVPAMAADDDSANDSIPPEDEDTIGEVIVHNIESNDIPQVGHYNYRRRRQIENQLNLNVDQIMIKDYNETIDDEYCLTEACKVKTGGNYSYSIGLSFQMPQTLLTLEFQIAPERIPLKVFLCGERNGRDCSGAGIQNHPPPAERHIENQHTAFDLPVGYLLTAKYKFRVSSIGHSDEQVCAFKKEDLNKEFSEYNVGFYIACP